MAADNVKTAFGLPSGVNKTLSLAATTTAAARKYQPTTTITKYQPIHIQVFRNIHSKRPVLKSLFNKVPGLQPTA